MIKNEFVTFMRENKICNHILYLLYLNYTIKDQTNNSDIKFGRKITFCFAWFAWEKILKSTQNVSMVLKIWKKLFKRCLFL